MKATRIVFPVPGKAELQNVELAPLGENEVRVKMLYTVVSAGTEYAFLMGSPNTAGNFPRALGYSASAEILEVGERVEKLKPGMRVTVYHGKHQDINNVNADNVFPIPDAVDDKSAAFTEIACMGLQGVRKLRPELGESGAVYGLGLLGFFALQSMKAAGMTPVIAVDMNAERLELARKLGATACLNPTDPNFKQKVLELTEKGINCVVEVTGAEDALASALSAIAREGRISLTGCTRVSSKPIDFYKLVHTPGVSIIGAHNGVRPKYESRPGYWTRHDDERTVLGLMADGRIQALPLIHEIHKPEDCADVYGRLAERQLPLGVLFDWNTFR